jgi:predicted MFS family arabinose efflux permease
MLVQSPVILGLSIYIALLYGYTYLLFVTFSVVFQFQYNFSQGVAGLAYLGVGVGLLVGLLFMSRYSDKINEIKTKEAGKSIPE